MTLVKINPKIHLVEGSASTSNTSLTDNLNGEVKNEMSGITLYFLNFHKHDPESSYHYSNDIIYMFANKEAAVEKAIELFWDSFWEDADEDTLNNIWLTHIGNDELYEQINTKEIDKQTTEYLKTKLRKDLRKRNKHTFQSGCAYLQIIEKITPLGNESTIIGDFGFNF